ncbi:MAG: DUF4294 domain-containing protein [Sphingobacteriaceae bacterium]|nr:DUF4294 domain-containing protein [Sphingobacteriaceae bacterium]
MKYFLAFLIFFNTSLMVANAQLVTCDPKKPKLSKNDTIRVASTVDNCEIIPWILLNEVKITEVRTFRSYEERVAYNRLRYNVLKVLPYALYAKRRFEKLERDLAVVSDEKEQKKLVKECDNEIKNLFNREVKELTITQGKILTKLIDRNLNRTTYDIIKENKGVIRAFVYQSIARVVGHDLKATYDAQNVQEDFNIEVILKNSNYYH